MNKELLGDFFSHYCKVCGDPSTFLKTHKGPYLEKDISDSNEKKIALPFNILFNFLPQILTHYMQYAASFDEDLFDCQNSRDCFDVLTKLSYARIFESNLSAVSRIGVITIEQLIAKLDNVASTELSFISNLTNAKEPDLLFAFENYLQLNTNPNLFIKLTDKIKAALLSSMLAKVGCSKFLNGQISERHHSTLDKMYEQIRANETDYSVFSGRYNSISPEQIFQRKTSAEYIMLMISLYTICCRVLLNKTPTVNFLDHLDIPNKIS